MMPGHVIVVGNCTLDSLYSVPRFPKPGETLLATSMTEDVGGKGANQAVAARRAGAEVSFVSAVGSDADGDGIAARLESESLGLESVARRDLPTDRSVIYVSTDGENTIVSTRACALSVDMDLVGPALRAARAGDVLLMQGNLSHDVTRETLEVARRGGLLTVVNPAPIQYAYDDIWPVVSCAILNEVEIEALGGSADPVTGARRLQAAGVPEVVVTLGARGAVLMTGDGVSDAGVEPVSAVDTTGAGDVFCGVFAAGRGRGEPADRATRLAVRAATLSVTRVGTQRACPSSAEIAALSGDLRSDHA